MILLIAAAYAALALVRVQDSARQAALANEELEAGLGAANEGPEIRGITFAEAIVDPSFVLTGRSRVE